MSQIYLRVNIEDNFKPLDIDNLRHEIENLVGVIEVYPCIESAQQSVQWTGGSLCECGVDSDPEKFGKTHLHDCPANR